MKINGTAINIKQRLTAVGGRTTQDLGLGRIVGHILVYLYLSSGECSLDDLADELGLSKAAVSIAARQLESLGLIRRSWRKGDRKTYYRTADDIATALHQGLLILVRNKLGLLATELGRAEDELKLLAKSEETAFLLGRVKRARKLRDSAMSLLESPVVRMLTRVP
jgi:DNA-binding transcriptional regulator GbsR (MarR family)